MIPAHPGWTATFKTKDSTYRSRRPVEAWDNDGHALVVDQELGLLVRASSYTNFDGLAEEEQRHITAVPGQGWTIRHTDEDGSIWTEPVIAFALDANGYGTVIAGSGDGGVMEEDNFDGEKKVLIPPGGWTPNEPPPTTPDQQTGDQA